MSHSTFFDILYTHRYLSDIAQIYITYEYMLEVLSSASDLKKLDILETFWE